MVRRVNEVSLPACMANAQHKQTKTHTKLDKTAAATSLRSVSATDAIMPVLLCLEFAAVDGLFKTGI